MLIFNSNCILFQKCVHSNSNNPCKNQFAQMVTEQCQNYKNIKRPKCAYRFQALWSFQMFKGHLFKVLNTVLLSGFQSSVGALKSTE